MTPAPRVPAARRPPGFRLPRAASSTYARAGDLARPRVNTLEFLAYDRVIDSMATLGVAPQQRDDLVRFSLDADDLQTASIAPEPDTDAARSLAADAARLPDLLDAALHAFHVHDVMLVPCASWGPVLDLIAFDLAADDAWRDIDAEAALHARSRDPLLMSPDDRHTLRAVINAIIANGDSEEVCVAVLAAGAQMVAELRLPAELRLACPEPIMETVMGKLEELPR